ncbi:MAG: type II 3-dehydroquinate dehydratase [Pseudomonadota bacterium]
MANATQNTIFVLNGPNLNLLGQREPEIYGHESLNEIEARMVSDASRLGFTIDFRQSNAEGALVDWVQEAREAAFGLIINPGAYTHTSIALLDALSAVDIPKIELHLSNIHAREPFRRESRIASAVDGVIMGFGAHGYLLGLDAVKQLIIAREE